MEIKMLNLSFSTPPATFVHLMNSSEAAFGKKMSLRAPDKRMQVENVYVSVENCSKLHHIAWYVRQNRKIEWEKADINSNAFICACGTEAHTEQLNVLSFKTFFCYLCCR